jgi:colanic acid/amylovoran biosynthesis glycosyltransferase
LKSVCIITPSIGIYSETFIQNQIAYLPNIRTVITTRRREFAFETGDPLAKRSLFAKICRTIRRNVLKEDFNSQQLILLKKHLKKEKIDHVLFQYGTTAKKAYKACISLSIPFTVHFHGYDAYMHKYDSDYYKEVLDNAKNIIVVSLHMKKQLLHLGCNEEKIEVIPYGTNFVTKTNSHSQNEIKRKFLSVGRFVEKKAPYLTILAFSESLKVNKNLKLDMIGDGILLPMCKDITKGLGIEKYITFHGACSHEKVQKMMLETDFFIQLSKKAENGDCEGLPNSIIEALTLQKPVISTFHSGIPEIVKNNVNGFLVDEGDIQATKNKILEALSYNFKYPHLPNLELKNSIGKLAEILNK